MMEKRLLMGAEELGQLLTAIILNVRGRAERSN